MTRPLCDVCAADLAAGLPAGFGHFAQDSRCPDFAGRARDAVRSAEVVAATRARVAAPRAVVLDDDDRPDTIDRMYRALQWAAAARDAMRAAAERHRAALVETERTRAPIEAAHAEGRIADVATWRTHSAAVDRLLAIGDEHRAMWDEALGADMLAMDLEGIPR